MNYSIPLIYLSGINLILGLMATSVTLQISKSCSVNNSIVQIIHHKNQDTISNLHNYEYGHDQAQKYLWAEALSSFHNGLQSEKRMSNMSKKAYYEAINSVYVRTEMNLLSKQYYIKLETM